MDRKNYLSICFYFYQLYSSTYKMAVAIRKIIRRNRDKFLFCIDRYVDKHTIGIYKLSYLSLEYDKALHKCVAVDFEYSHAFLKYSCRISFNPVTGEMVGTWSNQKVFKNKLNMSTWNLQLENMIKVSNMEWSSFTITAISYSIQYEGNHDYIEVEYYNGEKRVSLLGFRADDVPYWLR